MHQREIVYEKEFGRGLSQEKYTREKYFTGEHLRTMVMKILRIYVKN